MLRYCIALLIACLMLTAPAVADMPTPARNAMNLWLDLIDERRFGEAWDRASPLLQEQVERELWIARHQSLAFRDGSLRERRLRHHGVYRHIPDGPEGEYQIAVFSSRFGSALRDRGEVVTMEYRNGQWLPVGYFRRDDVPQPPGN